ncbi:MAG: carbohydrate porin [Betaproteobacteria bacterium]|nr:carbohydrate porin [Betaproteobacteria bacterium]
MRSPPDPSRECTGPMVAAATADAGLLGNMGGLRPWLSCHGMSLGLTEKSELFGNITGGIQKELRYDGLTTLTLSVDARQAFGWRAGTFYASLLQIHGRNLSRADLHVLQAVTNAEADRSTRLWELWYDQPLGPSKLDLRVGQQSVDQEWMVSQNAAAFLNGTFGWAPVPAGDLPGGGPAYPLSVLGARLRGRIGHAWALMAGLYNGSPVRGQPRHPQLQNRHGTSFPLNGGALAIAELQYAERPPADPASAPPTAVYKLGLWYDTEKFSDLEFDNTGHSLASPASTGIAQTHRGDYAFYAVADRTLWRSPHDPARTLNVFLRPMWTPLTDRNFINFSLNAGITMTAPFRGRDADLVGLGVGYAHVSPRAAALTRDQAFFSHTSTPVPSGETIIEATYRYQATPWLELQPDVQYVLNPGGGVANPNVPGQRIKNEAVFGIRARISF